MVKKKYLLQTDTWENRHEKKEDPEKYIIFSSYKEGNYEIKFLIFCQAINHFNMMILLMYLSGVHKCANLSNCSLKAIFCTPGVQTSSVDKHVDRKSRRKPDGMREPWLRLPSSLHLLFFALHSSRSISGAWSLPSFDLYLRARRSFRNINRATVVQIRSSNFDRISLPILFSLFSPLLLFYSINHPIYEPW